MKLQNLIDNLNQDLKREYQHLDFYITAATNVIGPHRKEFSEFFIAQANSELNHVIEFRKLIIGLGGYPTNDRIISNFINPAPETSWLKSALELETEVVRNYTQRLLEAEDLQENGGTDRVDGKYIEIFLEEQLLHSRQDADEIKEMLKEILND